MSDAFADLTAFQRDVLWVLSNGGAQKGVGVRSQLENYYEKSVNHGQVYPNLNDLIERNLVKKSEVDGRTNEYSLTEEGHRALQRRQAWVGGNNA